LQYCKFHLFVRCTYLKFVYNYLTFDFVFLIVSSAVTNLTLSDIMANKANVSWSEPCYINDINLIYSITIQQNISDTDTNHTIKTVSTTNVSTELSDLLPFRNYTVSVAPVNSIATGPSQNKYFRTQISGTKHKMLF